MISLLNSRLLESFTVKDVVEYVRNYEGKRQIFSDWTDEEIANTVHTAIKEHTFAHTSDGNGKLTGVAIGKWEKENFHIVGICADKGYFRYFLLYFKKYYPNVNRVTGIDIRRTQKDVTFLCQIQNPKI